MSVSPRPLDEEERLRALARYGVFGTPPEPVFDALTEVAARLFHAPISFVSLLDRDRQFFKSRFGVGLSETPRAEALCDHTIRRDEPMIVPDASLDPRFASSSLVTGPPHIRFYAGAPLIAPGGERIGTICVIDTVPREFSAEEAATLVHLAAVVVGKLERRLEGAFDGATAATGMEAHYRDLFESAPVGIFESTPGDPSGGLLSVNPSLARLFGYPDPAAMVGALERRLEEIYVLPGRRAELERRLAADGFVTGFESQVRRRDGATMWISENVRAVRGADGRAVRYEGAVADITERKAAERDRELARAAELAAANEALRQEIAMREATEAGARRSEGKFRALLENAQDLTTIVDAEGGVLYQTPSVRHVLGCTPDGLIGANWFDLIHPDDRVGAREGFTRMLHEGAAYVRGEARLRHADGAWRLLENVSSLTAAESPIAGLVIINSRDVTDRDRAQREAEARARQQAAIAELGARALQNPGLDEMFAHAAALTAQALEIKLCYISEATADGESLRLRAASGWEPADPVGAVVTAWRGRLVFSGEETGRSPLIIADLRGDPRFEAWPEVLRAPRPVSVVSVRIQAGGRIFGTLCALSAEEPRAFSEQEIVFLQTMADLLSNAIERDRNEADLRAVEARYQRIVANAPGVVYQFRLRADGGRDLPFVSEGCRELFGVEPQAVYDDAECLYRIIDPAHVPAMDASIGLSAATLQPWSLEWLVRLPGTGEEKWLRGAARPARLPDGGTLWDGVILDVTDQHCAADALREAKEEAERANSAKNEFLSRMSHELRTPLNAILGFGQLLEIEDLGPRHNQSVSHVLDAGRRLLGLVNEVLEVARLESGGIEPLASQPVDLGAALEEAARLLAPLAERRGVRLNPLRLSCRLHALADPARLNQALLNLIDNAIKYNAPGGQVRFSCRRLRDGRVRVAITDQGPGLSGSDAARLFAPFERLDASHRGIGGIGAGLTVAKRLVEAMRGAIGVRSRLGRGSTFYLELPGDPADDGGAARVEDPPPAAAPPAAHAPTVLHVEDEPANAALIERIFESRPELRLLTASDGRTGLEMARDSRPDLILLDLHLPDLPGEEVLRRLRENPRTAAAPVIVLSADALPEHVAELRQLGAHDYLTKPLDAGELLRVIDRLFPDFRAPVP